MVTPDFPQASFQSENRVNRSNPLTAATELVKAMLNREAKLV
jgi:hypothetical protein